MTTAALGNILTPTEVKLFEENYNNLREDYKKSKRLSVSSLLPILGRPPIIPDSPDMDAMLDAYDARAEYGRKAMQIEQVLAHSQD